MLADDLNNTFDTWIRALENYNTDELYLKPGGDSWSIGQVYMHLAGETRYFVGQAEACLEHDENASVEMSVEAKALFARNEFPDVRIKRGPFLSDNIEQPASKQKIREEMKALKKRAADACHMITNSRHRGKTAHPGFGYFDAQEWLRYAEMHLRHHLRQKKRIDDFLKIKE